MRLGATNLLPSRPIILDKYFSFIFSSNILKGSISVGGINVMSFSYPNFWRSLKGRDKMFLIY